MGLTNRQQAILLFIALLLAPVGTWIKSGMATDGSSLSLLFLGLIAAYTGFVMEDKGSAVPQQVTYGTWQEDVTGEQTLGVKPVWFRTVSVNGQVTKIEQSTVQVKPTQ